VGGAGRRKTIPLIARWADMWNLYGSPAEVAAADALLRVACDAIGRDEGEIERTVNLNVVVRPTREDAEAAWADWFERYRPRGGDGRLDAAGPVADVVPVLAAYRAAGFAHPVLVFRPPWDLETMAALPELRAMLGAG
jgi:alkanesulfonate monooxygenase SsuD/methylene tetrahydromethanopterin reductase-like flavin-dependent oxidoreductase (luciferase family)